MKTIAEVSDARCDPNLTSFRDLVIKAWLLEDGAECS